MKLSAGGIAARSTVLLAALAVSSSAIASDADSIKTLERKLERSMQLIEELSAKVKQLEQASATVRAPQATAAAQPGKVEELEKQLNQLTSSLSRGSVDAGVPIHGFADVGLGRNGEDNVVAGKQRKGFTVGTFDLFMTPKLGDRVRSLVELAFEVEADGKVEADLERVQIGYAFNDAATGWMGRFHTPYGYWNTAFHHGAQIQTSITRPRFLEFEDFGGILPAHTTGVWLTGNLPLGAGKFGYDAYFGNSPAINATATGSTLSASNATGFSPKVNAGTYAGTGVLNMQMSGAGSHLPAAGYNVWYEPHALAGLRLGLHGLRASVEDNSADRNRTRLNMFGGYAVFSDERWELMGEYYRFRNQDISGSRGIFNSSAGYLQAGYNIGRITPFIRFESTRLNQQDNYFAVQRSGRSYQRQALGLRFDVDPKAALKFEYDRNRKADLGVASDSFSEARIQYSIRF